MTSAGTSPYGAWASPITTDLLVGGSVRLGAVGADGAAVLWLESRPDEGGRSVLVRKRPGESPADLTPMPWNVRTRAHEYGGGAFLAARGRIWFCNDSDQRIYRIENGAITALTPEGPWRYADMVLDLGRNRLVAVREDHGASGEPRNELVAIDLATGRTAVLASGHDFYSNPSLSPDGERLLWLTWDHPRMPWQGTEVWVSDLDAGGVPGAPRRIAGGPGESVFQPSFGPDGHIYLVSDASGWWNLYRWRDGVLRALTERAAEFGRPQWQFGMRTYGFDRAGRIVCCCSENGSWSLAILEPSSGRLRTLDAAPRGIEAIAVGDDCAVVLGGSPGVGTAVVTMALDSGAATILRRTVADEVDDGFLSVPEAIRFATGDGEHSHAFFYRPTNADVTAPAGARPPLLVVGHGGPTASTSPTLDLRVQYWTSRGFAVLDVNYRGSTGHGRPYRDRLAGAWGVVDVEDCVAGARHLAGDGAVDPAALAIRGSSAGGYTTLAALTFHDVFGAGASYYGISELEALARDTHKFESRYLDWLIGPWPECAERYRARSPIHHVDRLSCPVIFFQGLEDRVVPPNQAQMMVAALAEKGLPVAYLEFEGEQHGFRKAETIRRTLEAELTFYGRIFGFTPAGGAVALSIRNA